MLEKCYLKLLCQSTRSATVAGPCGLMTSGQFIQKAAQVPGSPAQYKPRRFLMDTLSRIYNNSPNWTVFVKLSPQISMPLRHQTLENFQTVLAKTAQNLTGWYYYNWLWDTLNVSTLQFCSLVSLNKLSNNPSPNSISLKTIRKKIYSLKGCILLKHEKQCGRWEKGCYAQMTENSEAAQTSDLFKTKSMVLWSQIPASSKAELV